MSSVFDYFNTSFQAAARGAFERALSRMVNESTECLARVSQIERDRLGSVHELDCPARRVRRVTITKTEVLGIELEVAPRNLDHRNARIQPAKIQ